MAALLNVSRQIVGDFVDWVPKDQQILGRLIGDRLRPPVAYVVDLPIAPRGDSVDLDQDGEEDAGVRVFALDLASNLTGDSHLRHLDQVSYQSFLTDPHSGKVRQGTFLIHVPDSGQGFPVAAGDDGQFFTSDGPITTLPAGYVLATLNRDGTVAFDPSPEVRMDTLSWRKVRSHHRISPEWVSSKAITP